ncbi:sodium-coupled monocarboxylate transporter 1-like isoform X1 [Ylistrum balloti]|uniref:sodium-coupled monocarboxylate transporter 1-like isoform X1 n=1 Tax=Ylistrum balloti TaxID=509963 RepID=UPI00290584D1|nr:sodium-coupled monocarboxylate transporter 1-like isoform X1 [Ylistrum balloti]
MDEEGKYSFQTGERNTFGVVDYVLFALLLCVSASIGLFYAIKDRKNQNTKDFLLAGGNMSAIPVALSLLASFMSAITLLGTPAEMYNYTTIYWWIGLGYFFTIGAAAHIYVPVFYRLRVTSAYQYLEMRFGRPTRSLISVVYVIQMVLYMSIVLYAPSLAMNAVTGFTLWGSVWAVGLVCIFYTTIGGMKAVLWTDTFQVGVMLAGLCTILIQGSIEVGGFSKAWQYSVDSGRILFDDFNPDPIVRHSVWSCVFGGAITWLAVYGANQAQIQRAITCPTLRKAQMAYWFNFPGLCVILYLCCFIGTVAYAFYRTCDPKTFGLITASDQLLPLFVMDVLGKMPGVPGIFVSCIFSGALSTLSSGLNSIAAVLLEDVVKVFCVSDLNEQRATNASKLIALVSGFICLGLTYVASMLGGVLQAALALFGMLGGPILGVFTLGIIFPWANQKGALTAVSSGVIFMLWIGVGYQVHKPPVAPFSPTSLVGCNWNLTDTNFTQPLASVLTNATVAPAPEYSTWDPFVRLYSLSYLWYSATAMLYTVCVGLIVSFATGRTDPKSLDPKLMCPLFDTLMPFLPEKILKPLRFGVDYSKMREQDEAATRDEMEIFVDKNNPDLTDVNGRPS